MKASIFVLATLILTLGAAVPAAGATAGEAGSPIPPAMAACTADPSAAELAAEWSEGAEAGSILSPEALPATHPLPPPCPEERDCTGPVGNGNTCETNPANCRVTKFSSLTDTGLSQCTLPDGSILRCKAGQTVFIRSAPCTQCPCCVPDPFACLCPNDCGSVVRIGCA